MAQSVNINFRMDADLKRNMEQVCSDMGLTMTAAFTIFAKTVSREKRIPFEVTADPFYSESNMMHLRRGISALNEGKGVAHEIIEVDDEENMV
ncbi:MAG: type II toxin-antitoxin system RelB/DinJ family antitoxin [Clostridiales bacterium]|nr:type II toxin-antitoxin system RelB/DinJ family antitoxin [Clostridiales bacterium]MCD8109451.1 type II toxin-antitoxin system RelB/DinJ family antitoxin [Clostridiales bacterium]MCD8132335.1 type II toxin-antitoxin system RelB/DinJ family antitoxin [Clostridiales bacterium]